MAEVIDRFPTKHQKIYPWDEWLDGRVWKLTRGEDFTCKESALADRAKHAAKKRNLTCETSYHSRRGVVYIQATGLDAASTGD